jgi:hypothetical protein
VADIPLGVYRHWKGTYYLAVAVGKDSNNGAGRVDAVVYVSLSPPHVGAVRVRHVREFLEVVPLPDGGSVPRFVHVGPSARLAGWLRRVADWVAPMGLVEAELRFRLAQLEGGPGAAR